MDVRINQMWSTALEVPVQGQSLMETGQSLVQSLVHTKMWTLAALQVRNWSFFSTILYRDHIESYLSELGYSELVQGQFEKMAFSRVDPLLVELNAVLEGQPRLHAKALMRLTIDIYPWVIGVHFLHNLVPLHSRLTNNKASEQLVSLQGLSYRKFAGSLEIFQDRGELLSLLILLSLCLAF